MRAAQSFRYFADATGKRFEKAFASPAPITPMQLTGMTIASHVVRKMSPGARMRVGLLTPAPTRGAASPA